MAFRSTVFCLLPGPLASLGTLVGVFGAMVETKGSAPNSDTEKGESLARGNIPSGNAPQYFRHHLSTPRSLFAAPSLVSSPFSRRGQQRQDRGRIYTCVR